MSRASTLAFAALIVATVAAFFVTQHLKVTTPLIAGTPMPSPAAINPVDGTVCGGVDHRGTRISFYLLHRADDVDVYVVDQGGSIVRTLAIGRHMRRGVRIPDGVFYWNGREDNGSIAPDGTYYFRVALLQQGRTVDLTDAPVTVKTTPPQPVVTGVSPSLIPQDDRPVTIHLRGNEGMGGFVKLYRTDQGGKPRLLKSFGIAGYRKVTRWDGTIHGRPAPAGTYLVGLTVTDAACNTGRFPPTMPPAPGSTPHAGVTVRYLAAQPPFDPVAAGSRALVYVDARRRPYRWSLMRAGAPKPLASGGGDRVALRVPVPARLAGLYELELRSDGHSAVVPLVANGSRRASVLVVLPALTWQGLNPVDDDGDGIPDTLAEGGPIELNRPLVDGLPAGFADEAQLLAYLDSTHRSYELTTDLALARGVGARLSGHPAVVLAGSERWLPSALGSALRSYVLGGGHLLSLGVDSLLRGVTVQRGRALDPTPPAAADPLGARLGALVTGSAAPLVVIRDRLGIFTHTSGAFAGFTSYQPITSVAPPGDILSEAGVSYTAPSIVAYSLGRGTVVDIAIPGFGSSLSGDADAKGLVGQVWSVLSRAP